MSAVKFKAGDRVRAVRFKAREGLDSEIKVGDEFVVDSRLHDSTTDVYLVGLNWSCTAARFELVRSAEKTINPSTQLGRVLALTNGQGAWTLAGIAAATGASEAAVSARLRELRTHGYTVDCEKPKGEAQRRYTVRAPAIALPA